MNFEHLNYLPWILGGFFALLFVIIWLERSFFKMVYTYWFYKRSFFSYISTLLFLCGMGVLLFSLVDVRGPEEKIKSAVPTERTIILVDTSASMLAEDVKPSRLQKAVLIAKHFARKAAGQQLAIVAFAEIQKKIVPFTTDLDLIDARLESIKNLRNQNGSSALSGAIQESIQYFKETGDPTGNILVLTDGEETAEGIGLQIPKDIHVALVGVGTTQGGRIPLDDGHGLRFGYKKNRGTDIITKLNESFFKKTVADIPSADYWLANTYNFPTDDILDFFKSEMKKGDKEQDMVIRPVMMEWVVVPALILLALSYFFKALRVFSLGLLLIILPVHSEEDVKLTPEIEDQMNLLQRGELTKLEKIKLADQLHKAGAKEEGLVLYEENLKNKKNKDIPPEALLNYGTALLEKGEVKKGLEVYDSLLRTMDKNSEKSKKIKELMDNNVLNFFKVQEQKKKEQKEKQDKENQENKDQKENQQSGSGSSGEQGSNQKNQQGQGQQDKKDKSEEEKLKKEKDQDQKNKESDQEKDQSEKKDKEKNETEEQGERKKLPPQKVSPKLKQLMSDDRQLQLKIIEQGTRDMNRRQNRDNKDW